MKRSSDTPCDYEPDTKKVLEELPLGELSKFLEKYVGFSSEIPDEITALVLLKNLPIDKFVLEQLPLTTAKHWITSSIFKTRSQCLPSPFECGWDNYTLDCLNGWCFFNAQYERCLHKGCTSAFKSFELVNEHGFWYRALYMAYSSAAPKTSTSSILNNRVVNITYPMLDDLLFIPEHGFVFYSYDECKSPESERTVVLYKAKLKKGSNLFPFLNRRTVGFSIDIDLPYYYPKTFAVELTREGDINVSSKVCLTSDTRLTIPLYNRRYNFMAKFDKQPWKMCEYEILKFKDCIHLNRLQTEKILNYLIILMGGFPLSSDYTSKKELDDLGRNFYYFVPESFDHEGLRMMYEFVVKRLTCLDVSFRQGVEFKPKKALEEITMIYDNGPNPPTLTMDAKPVMLYEYSDPLAVQPSYPELNYLLVKPTGFSLTQFSNILKCLIENKIRVNQMVCRKLTDIEFARLYPNCLNRVFGPDWYSHMMAGPCCIIQCSGASHYQVRDAALQSRIESGLPWVKNVCHSAANPKERELMLELFADSFGLSMDTTVHGEDIPSEINFKIFN